MGEDRSLLGRIVTWTIIGIVAVLALKLVLGLMGLVFGFVVFALFTIGPILLVGWLVVKAWQAFTGEPAV